MVSDIPAEALARESVWYDKSRYEDAERQFHEHLAKVCFSTCFHVVVY